MQTYNTASLDVSPVTGYATQSRVRPGVLGAAVAVLVVSALARAGGLHLAALQTRQLTVNTVAAAPVTPKNNLVPVAGSVQLPGAKNGGAATSQTCTRGNYVSPTELSLTQAPVGLSKTVDAPQQYQIYGNTAGDLRAQVSKCAPSIASNGSMAEYTAETSYRLNWQYAYAQNGAGQCTLTNVKVGLHINQVMPLWLPSQSAAPGLADSWQAFMANLTLHESGHISIDEQYAQTLLSDLQQFPAASCDSIGQSVQYLVDAEINTLNQANDNYDADTGHGATQGAILPS